MFMVDLIRYATPEGDLQAYVSRPHSSGEYPAIVLLSDQVGFDKHFFDLLHRFVHAGLAVMAPDLYRQSTQAPEGEAEAARPVEALPEEQVRHEVQRALAWLRNQGYTQGHATAVVGIGVNAPFALWASSIQPLPPQAVVAVGGDPDFLREHAALVQSAVAGYFGPEVTDLIGIKAALDAGSIPADLETFPVDPIALLNPKSPGFDQEAAAQLWQRLDDFLAQQLANSWH